MDSSDVDLSLGGCAAHIFRRRETRRSLGTASVPGYVVVDLNSIFATHRHGRFDSDIGVSRDPVGKHHRSHIPGCLKSLWLTLQGCLRQFLDHSRLCV